MSCRILPEHKHTHLWINTWPPWMPGVISALYCLLCYCALTHPPSSSPCITLALFVFLSMLPAFWFSASPFSVPSLFFISRCLHLFFPVSSVFFPPACLHHFAFLLSIPDSVWCVKGKKIDNIARRSDGGKDAGGAWRPQTESRKGQTGEGERVGVMEIEGVKEGGGWWGVGGVCSMSPLSVIVLTGGSKPGLFSCHTQTHTHAHSTCVCLTDSSFITINQLQPPPVCLNPPTAGGKGGEPEREEKEKGGEYETEMYWKER